MKHLSPSAPWPYALEYIRWQDAASGSGSWQELDKFKATTEDVHSVGWVVEESAEAVVLVPHIAFAGGMGDGEMIIPTVAIRERRVLEVPAGRQPSPAVSDHDMMFQILRQARIRCLSTIALTGDKSCLVIDEITAGTPMQSPMQLRVWFDRSTGNLGYFEIRPSPVVSDAINEGRVSPASPLTPPTDFERMSTLLYDLPHSAVSCIPTSGHHVIVVLKDSLRFEFTETGEFLRMSVAQESLHSRYDQYTQLLVNTSDDSGRR